MSRLVVCVCVAALNGTTHTGSCLSTILQQQFHGNLKQNAKGTMWQKGQLVLGNKIAVHELPYTYQRL